jgi:acetyl esterase/lipase
MNRAAPVLGLVLAALAAAFAALIVAPAPSKTLALLAIVASEKSLVIVVAALLAIALALWGVRGGARVVPGMAVVLALAAVAVGCIPVFQALDLASERRVDLGFFRTITASIDTEGPGHPQKTVEYTSVDGRAQTLDVYLPRPPRDEPTRAVVVVHGGFWVAGQKGEAAEFSRWLAGRGLTVFDVEYRLSPQPNWKAAVGDVKCAVGWVRRHAVTADWKIDPHKITLLGRSAGGHLALVAAYTPGDRALPPSCETGDSSVDSVVAYYAPTDLAWGHAHPANPRVANGPAHIRNFVGGPPESAGDLYRALSPVERVTAAAPRTLLLHGGRDQFVAAEQMKLLADKLRAAGVHSESVLFPWAQHGFDFVLGGFSGQIAETVLTRFLAAR